MTDKMIDSTGDNRTVNNTMRHKYRVLTEEEKILMCDIKDMGQNLIDIFGNMGESRELSIAKTKMEEAVMWACKHITA